MDVASIITTLPPWVLFILLIVSGVLAAEGGAWVAQRRQMRGIKEPKAPIGSAVASMLALLAFILSFTFAITASRYAERKKLVVDHANAITVCYLKTSFIPVEQRLEVRKLLKEYVAILLQINISPAVEKDITRLEHIHLLIWTQAISLSKEEVISEIRLLQFADSISQVVNWSRARETVGFIYLIPSPLWVALLFLFLLSMFSLGYQTGMYSMRKNLNIPLLTIAVALVILMIAEMDSTTSRRFQISTYPLEKVYKMMQQDIP